MLGNDEQCVVVLLLLHGVCVGRDSMLLNHLGQRVYYLPTLRPPSFHRAWFLGMCRSRKGLYSLLCLCLVGFYSGATSTHACMHERRQVLLLSVCVLRVRAMCRRVTVYSLFYRGVVMCSFWWGCSVLVKQDEWTD